MKRLLSGNEAIALGAYHAGVRVATAYPGTPSTEILERMAAFEGVYSEWSINEKVALEVAMGAAYGGVRAMVSMKHVGLNVAADPFFAASVTGINGGMVVVSADDPGIHSSQNEQDNRRYAPFARVPMLEPADSQDAYDLMPIAFKMSEDYDTPVMLRTTTRISHCKSIVNVGENARPAPVRPFFKRDFAKYVQVPAAARQRHPIMEERLRRLLPVANTFPLNQAVFDDRKLGIVSCGAAYQYAREVFPDASFLKLVMTHPFPSEMVLAFARKVDRLMVIEELDPYIEDQLWLLGLAVSGKQFVSACGELSVEAVEAAAQKAGLLPAAPAVAAPAGPVSLPLRPPLLCPGCPHRGAFYALRELGVSYATDAIQAPEEPKGAGFKKSGILATGDIGCYTLGVQPPLRALDTTACMGASIGQAHGLEKAGFDAKTVAVIGDSTFMHSGITPLANVVYNGGHSTVIILDNGTTAMTGHQGHPGTGLRADGRKGKTVRIEKLVEGLGIDDVSVVDSFNIKAIENAVKTCIETDAPSVIVVRGACPLEVKARGKAFSVDLDRCNGCSLCLRLGCPAIVRNPDGKVSIDESLCVGKHCTLCRQVCARKAILDREVEKAG